MTSECQFEFPQIKEKKIPNEVHVGDLFLLKCSGLDPEKDWSQASLKLGAQDDFKLSLEKNLIFEGDQADYLVTTYKVGENKLEQALLETPDGGQVLLPESTFVVPSLVEKKDKIMSFQYVASDYGAWVWMALIALGFLVLCVFGFLIKLGSSRSKLRKYLLDFDSPKTPFQSYLFEHRRLMKGGQKPEVEIQNLLRAQKIYFSREFNMILDETQQVKYFKALKKTFQNKHPQFLKIFNNYMKEYQVVSEMIGQSKDMAFKQEEYKGLLQLSLDLVTQMQSLRDKK